MTAVIVGAMAALLLLADRQAEGPASRRTGPDDERPTEPPAGQ
ncbi:hypothetical protein AB0G68_30110 [Streptomyces eurythermus]